MFMTLSYDSPIETGQYCEFVFKQLETTGISFLVFFLSETASNSHEQASGRPMHAYKRLGAYPHLDHDFCCMHAYDRQGLFPWIGGNASVRELCIVWLIRSGLTQSLHCRSR